MVQSFEQGRDAVQLGVGRIVIPIHGWDGILGLEEVGHGGVIDDNDVLHGPTKPSQVLHVCVVEEGAVLAEEEV